MAEAVGATELSNAGATPAQQILLTVRKMKSVGRPLAYHAEYSAQIMDFVRAAPSSALLIVRINDALSFCDLDKALAAAEELVSYEEFLLMRAVATNVSAAQQHGAALRVIGEMGPAANVLPA